MKKNWMTSTVIPALILVLAAVAPSWGTMATTTHGAPKPVYNDSGSAKATEFNDAQDAFDLAIWAALAAKAEKYPTAAATGTDTITATYSPAVTLTNGTRITLVAAGANTGAVTFAPNSLTAKAIVKYVSTALVAGDIPAAGYLCDLEYNGTAWVLLDPGIASSATSWGPYATITGPTGAHAYAFPDSAATMVYQNIASLLLGTASSATGSAVFYNVGNANAFTIQPGATGAALSWTLPIAAPGGNGYLVTASTAGVITYTDPATLGGSTTWATLSAALDPATLANTTWNGEVETATAGENLVKYNLCYLKSDGKYWKAKGDVAGTMPGIAMATATINADASGVFLKRGIIRYDTWSFTTNGVPLYVDSTTAGLITATAPTTVGHQVQEIARVSQTDNVIWFNPINTLIEVGSGMFVPTSAALPSGATPSLASYDAYTDSQTADLTSPAIVSAIGTKRIIFFTAARAVRFDTSTTLKGNNAASWTTANGAWMELNSDGTYWRCAVHGAN